MYRSLYGLVESPFNLTPDPRYLFLSRSHQEAYDHLRYGIDQRKDFIEVIGGIGTGKTTLCKAFLKNLDPRIRVAYIFNPSVSEIELLRAINKEFGLNGKGQTKMELIDSLNQFLIEKLAQSGRAVLIIDESQNLDPRVLEEIRMLSNLETDQEKLIQIVLVGQPELHELLNTPFLKQLNERISVRAFIKPLSKTDTKAYIHHRLAIAGSKGRIRFTEGAFKRIYRYSQGNPRRINNICDRSLLVAFTKNSFKIRKSYIKKAISEIEGVLAVSSLPQKGGHYWLRLTLVILLTFPVAFGTGWLLRTQLPGLLTGDQKQPLPSPGVVKQAPQSAIEESSLPEEDTGPKTNVNLEKSNRSKEEAPKQMVSLNDKGVDLASLREIFRLLKIPFPNLDPETASIEQLDLPEIARLARAGGLLVIPMTLDVNRLRSFIVPILLEVYSEDHSRRSYIVMKKITDEIIVTSDPKRGEVFYPKTEIERIWFGNCLLFYPRPLRGKVPTLKEGAENPMTRRLQEQLASLGYYKGGLTGTFDTATKDSVLRFQRDFSLKPDAVVGRKTKAILFQLTGKSLYGD